jgi:hypothetical protein
VLLLLRPSSSNSPVDTLIPTQALPSTFTVTRPRRRPPTLFPARLSTPALAEAHHHPRLLPALRHAPLPRQHVQQLLRHIQLQLHRMPRRRRPFILLQPRARPEELAARRLTGDNAVVSAGLVQLNALQELLARSPTVRTFFSLASPDLHNTVFPIAYYSQCL